MTLRLSNRINLTSLAPAPRPEGHHGGKLNLAQFQQESSNWCWAACFQMVFNFYKFTISQCQMANYYFGSGCGKDDCCSKGTGGICDFGLVSSQITDGYIHWSFPSNFTPSQITFDAILNALGTIGPVEVAVSWTAGGGHAMIVSGFETPNLVFVNDPAYSSGPGLITYSSLQNAQGLGNWFATWTVPRP
jgi:hypothetical protein